MNESMENDCLYNKFKSFCEINERFKIAFEIVQEKTELNQIKRINTLLNFIATELFFDSNYIQEICNHFSNELPKLILHAISSNSNLIVNCILLGKIVHLRPDLGNYAVDYFKGKPCIFSNKINPLKKMKSEHSNNSELEFIKSCYFLLQTNPNFYKLKWSWSVFSKIFLNHQDTTIRWIACHCISIILGMNEIKLKKLIESKIPLEKSEELSCKYTNIFSFDNTDFNHYGLVKKPVNTSKINRKLIQIAGIYIPIIGESIEPNNNLIEVKSTYNNLRKICIGLNSDKAICLQGPVGCGKTTLIEYLAAKTGRKLGKDFIKIQLGDQTDSKMLLGTYCCTDIPGEFIWKAGVLTQAIVEGNWLLLEDIDSASMDIASILTSLLENKSLTIPGYRDSVMISPGFQLFVTERLLTTASGHHKRHSNSMMLLEKLLFQINLEPLADDELKHILITNYGKFETIADRMLNVFFLFNKNPKPNEITSIKNGRLISTRDFFKWCSRAIIDFDVSSQVSALKILQDAIDVFCCSNNNREESLNLAKEICTNLGIINQKAEYFYHNYKPTINILADNLIVGRTSINRKNPIVKVNNFYFTRPSAVLLEQIICCINLKEPVLLVGETGTGKTSLIQFLANTIGKKLIVINMNQQSDSADLLGGFKPVDLKFLIGPVKLEFEHIFCEFFKIEPNKKFLGHISRTFNEQKWDDLIKLMLKTYEAALNQLHKSTPEKQRKFLNRWQQLGIKLQKLNLQLKHTNNLAFAFIEGSLVKAVENGHWVLLDEINLANAETLECLSGLLEGSKSSLCLLERGDKQPVTRHPDFTLFACMNPSTDVGKKDLPAGLRNRFTEFFVDELTEKNDLLLLVNNYLEAMNLTQENLLKIVHFYLEVRKQSTISLSDGLGHKPHFSLRSLCRALMITAKDPCGMAKRSLYESFCLSFLTQLDSTSYKLIEKLIVRYLLTDEKSLKSLINQPIPEPKHLKSECFIQFEGYWIRKGNLETDSPENYILTESVRRNLRDLVRIVSIGKLPVLLQGDTSVGKTSLITYLAKSSGNKCFRINNHEHTDLQEYIGSYVADVNGKLVFREGLLVEAMRKGYWIILDELNLAPTDVLEALNRVLDDNRELFIPETQETIKANENFMLFATQNPPGAYGGRKMLSRAFRNRFVELHFNEIPSKELETILQLRCQIAPSYAKKMISVMNELQKLRRSSAAFAGKQGFITLRDLFRWGERYRLADNTNKLYDWDQHLADEGYLVLAGRVRKIEEKQEILKVLEKFMKRNVDPMNLFTLSEKTSNVTKGILEKIYKNSNEYPNIVWTFNMRQLAVMVGKALQFKEPVLLVGETGGGKTTICQLIANSNGQNLITVNCHMHTESSDFLGSLRPIRDHTENTNKLFEWVDGPLIHAMRDGSVFLADEISLADDSVLERLNSLLEPDRSLLLAEKSSTDSNCSELIIANEDFYFIGTMNPGGDYGKKELSPALRNRFTEIWCDSCTNRDDCIAIIEKNINFNVIFNTKENSSVGLMIMDFIDWFKSTEIGKRFTISIRDILTWVNFINVCFEKINIFDAYFHGACLTFLDSLGSGITGSENLNVLNKFRKQCEQFINHQLELLNQNNTNFQLSECKMEKTETYFGIKPFFIEIGDGSVQTNNFAFNAPTTIFNTLRLLRGMQLNKAILLEGSPGVGKTSLVTALAKMTGHKIFRVNLSDQTDISDLFGADLPVECGSGGQFSWRDGPLLQALKQGHWILLDELNLASQSVLEGLNACLDHRGEIFIPELGKTFRIQTGTRFFGCQNPIKQGGSRRGLPQSFLNRFIQVYVNSLTSDDLEFILINQFSVLPKDIIRNMVRFNLEIVNRLDKHSFGHKGGPWEFNLRDLTRWCEATIYHYNCNPSKNKNYQPENLCEIIYENRMRTESDRDIIREIFLEVFKIDIKGDTPSVFVNSDNVFIGDVCLNKSSDIVNWNVLHQDKTCLVLRSQIKYLRTLSYCVNLNWLSILVGGAGSGKNHVVKTLANLAGKTLKTLPITSAIDTTDILGGFEQTDYTRHLDDLIKKTEQVLLKTVQMLIIDKDRTSEAVTLLEIWEDYKNIEEKQFQHKVDIETELFKRKLNRLENIWENLLNFNLSSEEKFDIKCYQNKANYMYECLKAENSLNSGGKFEWVDSILIKCLQEGLWLLIDNVNLCSAAVLDRLNALLEPNGILTIGERGVDSNGKMIEIQPHKDFRLFLTMDPKNGEISRAMRNRGVEIFLLNDINEYDLKSLINLHGLKEISHINGLLKIHYFICDLILGERPNINELLRASSFISHQINQGTDLFTAFFMTIIEVYYKTRNPAEFNCNDSFSLIKSEVTSILETFPSSYQIYNGNITLKTKNLSVDCKLETIRQQATLINENIQNFNEFTINLFINYYTITTLKDLTLRKQYIENILPKNNFSKKIFQLNYKLFKFIHNYKDYLTFNMDLPLDYRWLPDLFYIQTDVNTINKFILSLYLIVENEKESFYIIEKEKQIKNSNHLSLRNYIQNGKENKDCFLDDYHLLVFKTIEKFNKYFRKIMDYSIDISTDEKFIQTLYLIKWRFIFYRCTLVNYRKINPNEKYFIDTNIKVHFRWFLKNSIEIFFKIVNTPIPTDLSNILKNFYKFDSNLGLLYNFGKKYQKCNEKISPCTSENEINLKMKFYKISKLYDISDRQIDSLRVSHLFINHLEIRNILIELKSNFNYSHDNFVKQIKILESYHEQQQPQKDFPIQFNIDDYKIQLLPFIDYFSQLYMKNLFVSKEIKNNIEIIKNIQTLPINLIGLIVEQSTKNNQFYLNNEFNKLFLNYLMHSPSTQTIQYLSIEDGIKLHFHHPILTYYMSNLLIGDLSRITLGNFKIIINQHYLLHVCLWRNAPLMMIENFDYMYFQEKFAHYSYKMFIQQVSDSLGIENSNDIICIAHIKQLEINNKEQLNDFIKHLDKCISLINNLSIDETNIYLKLNVISSIFMELGYMKALLNCQLSLIDPLAKKSLKKKHLLNIIDDFENMVRTYWSLNMVYNGNEKALHPYYNQLKNLIDNLMRKNEKLDKFVAVRSFDQPYDVVLKSVNNGIASVFRSELYIENMLTSLYNEVVKLSHCDNPIDLRISTNILNQYNNHIQSFENLLHEWSQFSVSYPDIIEPLLYNLTEFLYGFQLKLSLLEKLIDQKKLEYSKNLNITLLNLVNIPSLQGNQKDIGNFDLFYMNCEFRNFIENTLNDSDNPTLQSIEKLRLLKCGIQETFNNCILTSKNCDFLKRPLFGTFENFLKIFINAWNNQQNLIDIKQKQSESLYKTKTLCNDISEEEKIQGELNQLFPNYHDYDFNDLQRNHDHDSNVIVNQVNSENDYHMKEDDLKFVVSLHIKLMKNFTKTEWLLTSKDRNINPNFVNPFIEKFKILKLILAKHIKCLDYQMDQKLLESFIILLSIIQQCKDTIDSSQTQNFYKNPNIDEVKSSYHIIEELRIRVKELLSEWPDHPTLKTIIIIIERIYNFEMNSSLARFLTGFEILLSKCHEWEEVAHSGVSLSQYSQNITQQIIKWRKMELQVWKNLMNSTFERLNEPINKWWLYLYNIMEEFLYGNTITDVQLIESIQIFITKSNLAEFHNRLELLFVFHCHGIYLEDSLKRDNFIKILWNLYNYFKQFSQKVSNKIKELRTPIEKKLNDYVKIVRWHDINYWAVKQTVDKSHKTLHKFVKEYENLLQQPVLPLLVNLDDTNTDSVGIWDKNKKSMSENLDVTTYLIKRSVDIQENFNGKYFRKFQILSKKTITSIKYPQLIKSLNDFITDIIETSNHLQKLEVDGTLPKNKQKSQAKSILNQKHRALADLFKNLSNIGLSFRTGIIESKLKSPTEDFLMKPINITANFNQLMENDLNILSMWDNCENYYLKSLIRIDILNTALNNPAPDLGIQNIERCKGFTSHLFKFAQIQKIELIETTRKFYYLRFYFNQIKEICNSKEFLPITIINELQQLLEKILIVSNEIKLFLNSCPKENSSIHLDDVIILKSEINNFIQFKEDSLWNTAYHLTKEIINNSNKMYSYLEMAKGRPPVVEYNLIFKEFIPVNKEIINKDFNNIYEHINNLLTIFIKGSCNESLSHLNENIKKMIETIENEDLNNYQSKYSIVCVQNKTDKLIKKILFIIQNLYKKYHTKKIDENELPNKLEENLLENHLKEFIINSLSSDNNLLKMNTILKYTEHLSKYLFLSVPLTSIKDIISSSLPFLEQILSFYQYFILQQISAYRVTCKMTSILLNIFIELSSKGFCIPPELQDGEQQTDSNSKPSDGLGLGDGKGERDVSDRIESEDQLDDAQPAGQEKQNDENNDDDCKEEEKGIEMSEDFQSKLQDINKNNEDDNSEEDSDSDAEEQMGETDNGANNLDKEIWGSDNEDGNEDENENEKEEKGNKGEKDGCDEMAAKENETTNNKDDNDENSKNEKEKSKPEINEIKEPEYDDEQIDPYHGNQPELPEPEPMDLPEDLQLDGDDEKEENPDEDPFNIDTIKEQNIPENKDKDEKPQENGLEQNDNQVFSSDDEDITKEPEDESENEQLGDDKKEENEQDLNSNKDNDEKNNQEENKKSEDECLDNNISNENEVQAMEVDNCNATDKVENKMENVKSNQPIEDVQQEDKSDKDGVGQSQMEESSSGHSVQANVQQQPQSSQQLNKKENKRLQKPGNSNEERSLGDIHEPVQKKLKTIDNQFENNIDENKDNEDNFNKNSEMYEHIKDAKENSTQVLDVATKEQIEAQEKQVPNLMEEDCPEATESTDNIPEDEIDDNEKFDKVNELVREQFENNNEKKSNNNEVQHPDGDILKDLEDIEVDGDFVETFTVMRGAETCFVTQFENIKETFAERLTNAEICNLRLEVEQQLSAWNQTPSTLEAEQTWQKISSMTLSLAQDLSEQLRLVLEPTQASRLKGDFRTGRRINMRKVIPYIASQFRKDKIWLRRTKPSKRDYQIVLAIDDSSSMSDNKSKELAFESVSLISKALSLLESGQLSVVSFGKTVEILHKLTDQFTEKSGIQLLQKFKFDQTKTDIAKLVNFTTEMFNQNQKLSTNLNSKLLLIVGDGRGIFSEGESYVRQAVRRAKLLNIFMVFIIIDHPENRNSVLDIRMFKDGKLLTETYMDLFPFSFYIILKDINGLPNVLSDALRQWFEIVSNIDK